MKIAVERKIIDTDNIYSISEILKEHNYMYFEIESFDDKILEVKIENWADNKISEIFENMRKEYLSLKETNKLNPDDWKKVDEFSKEIPKENKRKLESIRQDIIKIWSENQSKIPVFKVENY